MLPSVLQTTVQMPSDPHDTSRSPPRMELTDPDPEFFVLHECVRNLEEHISLRQPSEQLTSTTLEEPHDDWNYVNDPAFSYNNCYKPTLPASPLTSPHSTAHSDDYEYSDVSPTYEKQLESAAIYNPSPSTSSGSTAGYSSTTSSNSDDDSDHLTAADRSLRSPPITTITNAVSNYNSPTATVVPTQKSSNSHAGISQTPIGIARYIVGEADDPPYTATLPAASPKRNKKRQPPQPWFCVSRPIHEQTRDLPIRNINRSSSIQTARLLQQCHSMLKFCSFKETVEEINENNISQLNHNHHWGDSLPSNVKGKTLRVIYQNVHRSLSATDNPSTNTLFDNLKSMEVDVFMAAETNRNWKASFFRNQLRQKVKRLWTNNRIAFSSSDIGLKSQKEEFLPGGTCTMAFDNIATRTTKTGEDDSGLGRWSFITLEGQDGRKITFITAYRICGGPMRGTTTSCMQQSRVINEQEMSQNKPASRIDTNFLRQKFIADLTAFILALQAEGHAIVLGIDANESPNEASPQGATKENSISALLEATGLQEVFESHHGHRPDSTTTTPGRFIDRVAVSGIDVQRVTLLRANEPAKSDHLAIAVDINLKALFNNACSPLTRQPPRKLTSDNPDAVRKYISFLQKQFDEHKIVQRLQRLKDAHNAGTFTDQHQKQLFALDNQVTEILLGAENQCSSKRITRNWWSPALKKAGDEIVYWRRRLSTNGCLDDGTRDFGRKLQLPATVQVPMSIDLCKFYLDIAWKSYRGIQRHSKEYREKFLKERAKILAAKGNGDEANALKQIRKREKLRRDYSEIRSAYGKEKQGLATLDVPNPETGGRTLITDATEVHEYLLKRNKKHYSQATYTTFGDRGPGFKYIDPDDPESDTYIDDMLNGVFEPWETASPYLREWLQALRCTVEKEMDTTLHLADFISLFKSIPESTASSVSGLHYGHYKTLSKHENSTFIEVLFDIVNLAFQTHSPLPRWRLATQLMLEKGKGPAIENLRIIQLLEADMNWLLRFLWGRKLNYHAQAEGAYNENQFAVPGKLCCSAILNKVLFFDLMRQTRQCGALMDNDATAAFDRVLPALCVVTCRQLGMPREAQRFFFRILRQMEYTVTTAHGQSKITYKANEDPDELGQGVIQGGGASGPNYASQQHPVLKAVEKNCTPAVFRHASKAKKRFKRWVTGFADDMSLLLNAFGIISTQNESRLPILRRLRDTLQTNVARYEEYFAHAGGALNLRKCFYYLFNFEWTGSKWQYQLNCNMQIDPIQITPTTLDNSGVPHTMEWLEANDARRTLGSFVAPDGSSSKQLEILHGHLKEWKKALQNINSANLQAKWISFKNVFSAKIMYPMIGHNFSEDDLHPIQQQVDKELLHILGLNEHFPRAVLRAPLKYGGMGCATFHAQHVIDKVILFLHHIRERKQIAEALLALMSTTQLECGMDTPFFTLPATTWYPMVTPTWPAHIWSECQPRGIEIQFEQDLLWLPKAQREHDICIMKAAAQHYEGKQLEMINQCRVALQVTFLSDIVSVDGRRVLLAYHSGKGHEEVGRRTRLNWPPIGQLPRRHWALWREFLDGWIGTSLRLETPLGDWYSETEVLTSISFFLYQRRLIFITSDTQQEFLPFDHRSRTRFSNQSHPLDVNDRGIVLHAQAVDVCFRNNSIYIISQREMSFVPTPHSPAIESFSDLYHSLPPLIHRVIGYTDLPPQQDIDKIAQAIQLGTAVGVSDGSVRPNNYMSSHAWIIQAGTGESIQGKGPVDGTATAQTSHRAELQGQAAIFLMLGLITHYYNIVKGRISTFCDNQSVVTKIKEGWKMLRLKHTKGPDSDLQMLLQAAIQRMTPAVTYTTEWIKGHQDKDADVSSLPRAVALNVQMDHSAKLAYDLPDSWLSKEFVPVFPDEKCAVYVDDTKITSAIRPTLLDKWHEQEALTYLTRRHDLPLPNLRYPHWPALHFALKKLSPHRRAVAVKALHRHLPTQAKLFSQGRITMTSLCPRCLQAEESNAHVYCCPQPEATQQRKQDWLEFWKQMTKIRTSSLISRTWRYFLLPILGLPLPPFSEDTIPDARGEVATLLDRAIYEQTQIGWDKLLLGLGSTCWRTLQHIIDCDNPKPPKRSASSWINTATFHLLKFSLRCWKARNTYIHGATRRECHQKALQTARSKIANLYASPPQLDPRYRSILEVPLQQRLALPLNAAEQWLALIDHQIKVTKYNHKRLLRNHLSINHHFRHMHKTTTRQTIQRMQSPSKDTPRKAHTRAVQLAVKAMKEKLYNKQPQPRGTVTRPRNKAHRPTRNPASSPDPVFDARPSLRRHPP